MRNADTAIPVMLGNLRQEIQAEKALLRYRIREGDRYAVFSSMRRRRRRQHEVTQLLEITVNNLWQEFKNVERPFLIKNPRRAEQVLKGDFWGDSDVDEKAYAAPTSPNKKETRNHMDMAEAGLSSDQQRYYRTDIVHRFIW